MNDLKKLVAAKGARDTKAAPLVAAATAAKERATRIRQAFEKLYVALPSVDRSERTAADWITGFVSRLQDLVAVADETFWTDVRKMVPRGENKEAESAALAILLAARTAKPAELAKTCLQLTLPGPDGRWQWEWASYFNFDTFLARLFAGDLAGSPKAPTSDSSADNAGKIPENLEVVKLSKFIQKNWGPGESERSLAIQFTEGDEKKADSLLRQRRRFKNPRK